MSLSSLTASSYTPQTTHTQPYPQIRAHFPTDTCAKAFPPVLMFITVPPANPQPGFPFVLSAWGVLPVTCTTLCLLPLLASHLTVGLPWPHYLKQPCPPFITLTLFIVLNSLLPPLRYHIFIYKGYIYLRHVHTYEICIHVIYMYMCITCSSIISMEINKG